MNKINLTKQRERLRKPHESLLLMYKNKKILSFFSSKLIIISDLN